MKLKFNQDGLVDGKVAFKKGEIYEISDELGSATRWLKRGAELVVVKEEVKPKKEEVVEIIEEVVVEEVPVLEKKSKKSK